MTTFPAKAVFWDARLQAASGHIGLQRSYFDTREYLRAKFENLDLSENQKSGVLFVHVPKCAGTSIIRQMPIAHGHRCANFYRWRDPDLFERCFSFGFVRNPYDRLVSAFHYLRSDKTSTRDGAFGQRTVGHYTDFQEFVSDLRWEKTRRKTLGGIHFLPQSFYLCDRKGQVLVDFVGRTQSYADDLVLINQRTGLSLQNIRERSVERADWREFYTRETAGYVYDIYSEDFEIFGFEAEYDF